MKALSKYIILLIAGIMLFSVAGHAQFTNLVVSLTGNILDETTKQPTGLQFRVYDSKGKVVSRSRSNKSNGYYFVTGLKPGQTYSIRFGDFNYFTEEIPIIIPNTDKYTEFSKDILVKPKKEGIKFKQKVSPFEIKKSKLRGGAEFFLKDITETLKKNPRVTFEIVSFPDNSKDETINEKLTKGRCESLKNYFIKNGIKSDRITASFNINTDPENPPPTGKRAKGKRYIGKIYYVIKSI